MESEIEIHSGLMEEVRQKGLAKVFRERLDRREAMEEAGQVIGFSIADLELLILNSN